MASPTHRPICMLCEHFVSGLDNPRMKPTCIAFPEGIPDKIFKGGFDHREALSNETITFKRRKGVSEEDVKEWEQQSLQQEKDDLLATIEQFRANETLE